MRNGRVLRGEIVRLGDRYTVTFGDKDEAGVPADSVEIHCASLEEAYQRKRDNLPQPGTTAEHLALADWCLRYELLASAAEQLMMAQRLEPENPALVLFERRLRLAAQQNQAPVAPVRSSPPLLPQTDLEQFVRNLPDGTVEQFTTAIQPLLVNRCGATACHGPNCKSAFKLSCPSSNRMVSRRFTQHNLHTAMQQVNTANPADSPLLLMATSAHGTCDHPTLGDSNSAQIQQLVSWLERCTANRAPPANLNTPDSLLLQPGAPQRDSTLQESPATSAERPPGAFGATDPPNAAPTTQPVAPNLLTPAANDRARADDPFDPEIFNRRYHRKTG
ncbi:MAG: hypothetical protein ACYC4N_05985 [Pirellulaceae bacterium]